MKEYSSRLNRPSEFAAISRATDAIGFQMSSDGLVGQLLMTLAAAKPRGEFLELGTGTGLSTCWIAAGMDKASNLISVDNDPIVSSIAEDHLGHDSRITFHVMDGAEFLRGVGDQRFDFVFADTWPGKYEELGLALDAVKLGGLYVADDMTVQPGWPAEHTAKVEAFIDAIDRRDDFVVSTLSWSTGVVLLTRRE